MNNFTSGGKSGFLIRGMNGVTGIPIPIGVIMALDPISLGGGRKNYYYIII